MEDKDTLLQKMFDLLKFIIPVLNTFPRNQKFVLADRIQNHVSDCYEIVLTAYYASSRDEKKAALRKANLKIETLRHYVRLCHELRLFSFKQYKEFAGRLDEVGRMVGGWINYLN